MVAVRKLVVQSRIYDAFGIRPDQILQGFGTTNTGNLARKCFQEPLKFAESLEIDSNLVKNISLVLFLFKSKKIIDLDEVEKLCISIYDSHNEIYPWARMNPSLHKLLMHGCQVARKLPMPLAYFNEEASEAWHKFFRKNIIIHARQNSRKARILDIYNRAVYMSDPALSLVHINKRLGLHKINKIPKEAQRFILYHDEDTSMDSNCSDYETVSDNESGDAL